mmetsp:Transcript_48549/g.105763  ORF Transcript_48549/g.105763 Transcript_48549/m.105763 type:complete len:251 (+) Transcript_48549:630-1382(+)
MCSHHLCCFKMQMSFSARSQLFCAWLHCEPASLRWPTFTRGLSGFICSQRLRWHCGTNCMKACFLGALLQSQPPPTSRTGFGTTPAWKLLWQDQLVSIWGWSMLHRLSSGFSPTSRRGDHYGTLCACSFNSRGRTTSDVEVAPHAEVVVPISRGWTNCEIVVGAVGRRFRLGCTFRTAGTRPCGSMRSMPWGCRYLSLLREELCSCTCFQADSIQEPTRPDGQGGTRRVFVRTSPHGKQRCCGAARARGD